jgi:uncharacterized protein YcsI (UPF0317 family)
VQANLVIVAGSLAEEFERFCQLNPRPLPLIERLPIGSPYPVSCAEDADLRTDLPQYWIYEDGVMKCELPNILDLWQDDWCAFLLGCSFTFDGLLVEAGIPVRHLELGCNVPMYETNRALQPSGLFSGNLVVSMRPIPAGDLARVVQITKLLPLAHGEPVHIGSPDTLGISDLDRPDYGDVVDILTGEVPVFWACGVTAQRVAQSSRIPLMLTHAPGHMFITDLRIDDLRPRDVNEQLRR